MLSGRLSLVLGRCTKKGEVLSLDCEALQKLVQGDSELSELLMRAFILRRVGLMANSQGDLICGGIASLDQHFEASGVSYPKRAAPRLSRCGE